MWAWYIEIMLAIFAFWQVCIIGWAMRFGVFVTLYLWVIKYGDNLNYYAAFCSNNRFSLFAVITAS